MLINVLKSKRIREAMQPLITLFTAPKPFVNPHIKTIQNNAIRSWKELGLDVSIVLIGGEDGIEQAAKEIGVAYFPDVKRNNMGTPLISSIFTIGRQMNNSPLLAYVNADIILFPDFIDTARKILSLRSKFLIVGQRWDMNIRESLKITNDWQKNLEIECMKNGKLHTRGGSDYFIYPRECFKEIPDFTVGRAGWDNWMFYEARRKNWPTIDATHEIKIIHQDHDYSHLPGGQSHYRLPETTENIRLAGGRRTIFTLLDVNYEFKNDKIRKFPSNWMKSWREVEIFPLIHFNSFILAQVFFVIFHPLKAYKEIRRWLSDNRNANKGEKQE
jgi:hypothetical protein